MNYSEVVKFWQDKQIDSAAKFECAINGKIIALAYHSGKIENPAVTYLDTREIFEHDRVVKYTGDLRTLFEIRNAKDAFNFILNSFDKKLPLDKDFLCQLQHEFTKNICEECGTFKRHDYVTGRAEVGAHPDDVDEEITELLDELHNPSDIITAAAYFHAKFENIHPFADGNGRTGRLALNYFLIINNCPPTIIFEEDRREYFDALEQWDIAQNLTAMKNFLQSQAVKTWNKS